MRRGHQHRRDRRAFRPAVQARAVALFAISLFLATYGIAAAAQLGGEQRASAEQIPPPPASADAFGSPVAEPEPGAKPVRITVAAIGVDAPLVGLGLTSGERAVDVPEDVDRAGWYRGGPRPGEVGPALLVGHVDSRDGPAVFFRLRELSAGDEVIVHYDDGSRWSFEVYHRARYAKDEFPTGLVYGNTSAPELRLVTCGGAFDEEVRHYRDNVIVWAGGGAEV